MRSSRRVSAHLAAWLLAGISGYAFAATPVVTRIGGVAYNSAAKAASTTLACPVSTAMTGSGNAIIVQVGWLNAAAMVTVSDTEGNTYRLTTRQTTTNLYDQSAYALNATNLTTSDTVNISFGSASESYRGCEVLEATNVAAVNALVAQNPSTATSGDSANPVFTSSVLDSNPHAVIALTTSPQSNETGYTESSGFSRLSTTDYVSGFALFPADEVNASPSAVSYSSTLPASAYWATSYLVLSSVPQGSCTLALLGVGSC